MLRFQQGEEDAFAELVDRNVGNVHALIYRFLGEASLLDDITQEVFLRIYRNAKNYQPKAKFSTWLYRIVANMCFNVMRSRKKGRPVSLESFGEDERHRPEVPDPNEREPIEPMENVELGEQIALAVNELPENQRVAIVLNKYEEKNYEEIAEVLGISTMAVKSLLSRARNNLRDKLERYLQQDRKE
jgi:RNA polymerase sigma-70 factor (ECF subfamily)